jgi:hypothetical protein
MVATFFDLISSIDTMHRRRISQKCKDKISSTVILAALEKMADTHDANLSSYSTGGFSSPFDTDNNVTRLIWLLH